MLYSWDERTPIVANLFNPAFTGEILRSALKGYYSIKKENMDFALIFLILPLILHKSTFSSLPKTSTTKFFLWYDNNKELKVNLPNRVKELVPFTRETICFLLYYDCIKIEDSKISVNKYSQKKRGLKHWDLLEPILKKSELLGKWFAKSGPTHTIYSTIGILP